jgi:hypothetical protein
MIVMFQRILTGLKMEGAVSPEVLVMFYCTTWPHIPENHLENTNSQIKPEVTPWKWLIYWNNENHFMIQD